MIYLTDLTTTQLATICNGCGPKSWKATIPTWHGRLACCAHDLAYWVGGTEVDRAVADRALYDGLIEVARPAWFGARVLMRIEAYAFYRSVRLAGVHHFHHGEQRTLADLPVAA